MDIKDSSEFLIMPKKVKKLPRVSICTPTFNRRPFFKGIIQSVMMQDYPKDLVEWVIVDDGTDPIEDLVKDIPFVKYFRVTNKMRLGQKRNYMHDMCSFKEDDAILVYMDDDDYYPSERISHAVDKLTHSSALCAGSSEIYIWFNGINKMYRFGPYGPNHSTAGTFAFKRSLLKQTRYEDDALLAEEKYFLKNYTIPFIQLNPIKTILVFSHEQNTFDKRRLINPNNTYCKESNLKVNNFIKSEEIRQFYVSEIQGLLTEYEPGNIEHKQDVLDEIKRRDNEMNKNKPLSQMELLEALRHKTEECSVLKEQLSKILTIIKEKKLQHHFI
jgi:glycosyltransferase involved in cell wall biosynthesis